MISFHLAMFVLPAALVAGVLLLAHHAGRRDRSGRRPAPPRSGSTGGGEG